MRCLFLFTLTLSAASVAAAAADSEQAKPLLTVLFTAEAHGALLPCDCPLQPIGGVARRATLIKRYRDRGPVLLVDGGGWQAGGIYDEDSDGNPERDRLRTKLMAQAMVLMGYDVIAGHEQESVLVSACWRLNEERLRLLDARGVPIEIRQRTGESGACLWIRSELQQSPVEVLRWLGIVLSRLGEEASSTLAADLKSEALVINAGRKDSQRIWWRSGDATFANFDYQAQRLGVAEIFAAPADSGRAYDIRVRLEPLTSAIPDDPEIAALLAPNLAALKKKGKQRVEIEYWTMPECPGCAQARADMERIAKELSGRASVSVHFVVSKEDGQLRSLHGDRELQEAGVQALVQKYYPEKIWDWLAWRALQPDTPWEEGARKFGLLPARIRGALSAGEPAKLLAADYELMLRRRVSGSPTLAIANRLYDDHIDRPHVLRVLCGLLEEPKPAGCKDVAACFFDAQCRKRGFIGRCVDPGKPAAHCDTSQPAVKVPAVVVTDRENIYDNHERILEALVGDLPGLDYRALDVSDPEGRALLEKAKVTRVPAYFFDPVAKTETGYAAGLGRIVREDKATGQLVLEGAATVGAHRLVNRPRIKGRADLFVSRLSKFGQEALEAALEYQQTARARAPEIILHDALYWKTPAAGKPEQRELAAANGVAEIEEAARAAAVKRLAPEKLRAYLLERGKKRGSSYWDVAVQAAGLDPARVRALAEKPGDDVLHDLYAEADLLKSLDAAGDIVLLAENCELIPIGSRRDLRDVFERIGSKK